MAQGDLLQESLFCFDSFGGDQRIAVGVYYHQKQAAMGRTRVTIFGKVLEISGPGTVSPL